MLTRAGDGAGDFLTRLFVVADKRLRQPMIRERFGTDRVGPFQERL